MNSIRKHFKKIIIPIALFATVLCFSIGNVQASTLYWFSTGSTDWNNSANWYTDAAHTTHANIVPGSNDSVILKGGVAPIINLDVSVLPDNGVDSTGLTGGAHTSGLIITSTYGNGSSIDLTGNATFNGNTYNGGSVSLNAIFNDQSYNSNSVGGTATFNGNSYNNGNIPSAIFNNYSYNASVVGSAVFNNWSHNNSEVDAGGATFNNNSFNYNGYTLNGGAVTFNDNSFDYNGNGSFEGGATFNNISPQFLFVGTNSGDWSDSGNWSNNAVPGPGDDAYISTNVDDVSNNDASVHSAFFYNNAGFDINGQGFILTTVATSTFTSGSYSAGQINGDAVFEAGSYNNNTIIGNAVFEAGSQNSGGITADALFLNSSQNYGTVNSNAIFSDAGDNQGTIYTNALFTNSSTQEGTIQGIGTLVLNSNNYGGMATTTFGVNSQNFSTITGDANFYFTSSNQNDVTGTATFYNDGPENVGTANSLVRHYIATTTTVLNFVTTGPWTVVADNVPVDVTGATFNAHTIFQTIGTGSFIGNTGFAGVLINTPTAGATVTSWSPSVSWHQTFNLYQSCQYSFGNIAHWNGTNDWNNGSPESGTWHGASCAGNGSDISAPTSTGALTMVLRAFNAGPVFATSTLVSFTYNPANVFYFYNSGADPSWTSVGNWYTNSTHTLAAGMVPRAIDTATIISSSTVPQVNLDTWTQPGSIYAPSGIIFTSANSASTSVTITGSATFNNTARNKGTINGNATFNGTATNLAGGGYITGNATFNTSSSNAGTVLLNATFYNDTPSNTGTVSGIKTRYYNATTTTTRNFTGGWTVTADGVQVTVSGATYNNTTKFKVINNGHFIGGPTTVYWWSNNSSNAWTNTAHWYVDDATTTLLTRLPLSSETVVTLGTTSPSVDLDNGSWVTPTGIDATKTGISFTSATSYQLNTAITGTTTFTGNTINISTISGNTTFSSTTKNNSGGVVSGNVTFNNTASNNGGTISGDVTFNNSSFNTGGGTIFGNATFNSSSFNGTTSGSISGLATFNNSSFNTAGGSISGNATFNSSSYNGTTSGSISGLATFNSTSRNDGIIANNAIFVGDSSANNGTTTGTQTRYYNANATTSRDFVTTGPWTVVADAAIVNLSATSTFATTTTFITLNGGSFTGQGVPGFTDCSKSLYFAGTYTFATDVTNNCTILADGITINGGNHLLGNVPVSLPDNGATANGINMASNALLYHMESIPVGPLDSVRSVNGTITGGVSTTTGKMGNGSLYTGGAYIKVSDAGLPLSGSSRSVSLWFNPSTVSGYNGIFGMTGGSNANDFYALTINNEVCIGRFGGGDTCSGSGTISTNTWYNLVITYDGTNARLYLNGILKATVARTYTTAGTGYLLIGKDYVQYDQFSGKIDEVSVWNRELSLGEISAAYTASTTPYVGNESGLVSLLHFDESVYNSVTDSSGQSRTGTGTGTFTSTMSAVTGNAFLFNGSNSDISVPGYSVSTSSQTVSMWVKLTPGWSSGNQYFLFNEGDSQQLQITLNNYCAGTSPSNNLCPSIYSGGGAGGGSINPNVRIGDDNWHHIALVDQANVGYLYVDGVLALSRSLAFSGSTGGLHIGNYQNGSFFSPVSMDEVAIWNRALSPTEIATIYAKQSFTIGIVGNSHSFNLSNITVGGPITSTGATIHLTNATTSRITVSGADATGNAQAGGTITLVNSSTGDLFANGGNSTDYGYGGAAGVVTKDANSSYTSKTNNAGSNGPNLASGQQTGTGVNVVLGCTDPTASNYNSNANTYDGTCRYPNVTVSGCTDPSATNYNSNATVNNGSCTYPQYTHYVAPPASNSGSNELPQNNQAPTNGTSPSGLSGLFSVYLPLAQVQKLDLKPFIGFGESTSKNSFSFVPFFEKFLFTPVASTTLGLSDAPELKAYLASLGITYDRDLVSLSKKLVAATTTRDIPGFYKVTSGSLKIKTANGGFASQDLVVTPYFTSDAVVPLGESVTLYSKDTITVSVIPTTKAKVSAKFNGKALSFEQTGKAVTVDITVPETSGRYILTTNASPLPLLIRAEKSKLVELPVPVSYKDKGLFGWIASFF